MATAELHPLLSPFAPIGDFLESIANTEVPKSGIWYIPPEQHVAETIFFNIVMGVLIFVAMTYKRKATSEEIKAFTQSPSDTQELSLVLKLYRIALLVCYCFTFFHKFSGNKKCNMLMPCHIMVTPLFMYSLTTRSHKRAEFAFNVSIHYMFLTWLALALPDHTGLKQPGEIFNFWVHHWVLFLIPFHLILTNHYQLRNHHYDPETQTVRPHLYFLLAIALGIFLHYDVMALAAIVSGLNVSYMLRPPPGTPLTGPWFRFYHFTFLVVCGWVCGYLIPSIVRAARAWYRHRQNGANAGGAVHKKKDN